MPEGPWVGVSLPSQGVRAETGPRGVPPGAAVLAGLWGEAVHEFLY